MAPPQPTRGDRVGGQQERRPTGIVVGQALGVATRSARVATCPARPPTAVVSTLLARQWLSQNPEVSVLAPPCVPAPMAPPQPVTTRGVRRAVLPRRHVASHTAQQPKSTTTHRPHDVSTANPPEAAGAPPSLLSTLTTTAIKREPDTSKAVATESVSDLSEAKISTASAIDNSVADTVAPQVKKVIVTKEERKRAIEPEDPVGATTRGPLSKRHMTEDILRAYSAPDKAKFLQLAGMIPQAGTFSRESHLLRLSTHASPSTASSGWTVHRKREAFWRIRDFLWSRLDVGLEIQRAVVRRHIEARDNRQGLFILGSSPQSTSLIIRSLLRTLDRELSAQCDYYHVKGHLYSTPHDLYDAIRHQMRGTWKLPQWRNVATALIDTKALPVAFTSTTSVLVVESIDSLVKTVNRTQAPLDRLFRFLNRLVQTRGLKLIVIGHSTQTLQRFTSYFGGFITENEDEYMLRLPQYTIATIVRHVEAVTTAALASMDSTARLDDVFAKQVIEFAARKAAKAGQCELDPVLNLLRYAMIRMLCQCRHDKDDFETDQSKWKLRYEHVIEVSSKLFQHDLVHRVQCVGTMTQAVLLVLIDAGPCTEEELFQRVYERHKAHVWILIITYFRREKFDVALELLLSVPVVKAREIRVGQGDSWRTEIQYHALPSRQQFIEAAGKKPLIKLIL